MEKFKRGDMVYFVQRVDGEEATEIEGYILEKALVGEQWKIITRNDNRTVFINEDKIVQIYPDYWQTLDEHIEENDVVWH